MKLFKLLWYSMFLEYHMRKGRKLMKFDNNYGTALKYHGDMVDYYARKMGLKS